MTRLPLALVALAACLGSFGVLSRADAQHTGPPWRVGVLLVGVSPESREAQGFRQALLDAGYAEGRDLVIEWRSANGDYARVPALVTDLLQRKADVIVVDTTVATRAAKRATSTTPIVMADIADPVGSGLVADLAHPGGNVTGLSLMLTDVTAKRLELLKEAIPRLARVVVLWNPDSPFHSKAVDELKAAAPGLSIELSFASARSPEEFGPVFSAARRAHAQALYIIEDPIFLTHRTALLRMASKARLPTISGVRQYADGGALVSYGASYEDLFRRSAGYVDKILKGANPGDLPIEQPTKFEFVLNLKAARALGLSVPQSMLLRADDVIR